MAKLTLEKIGEMAGVSRSTVSRVINNHPNVKPEVRERVMQVVNETGYHPDPAARSLASHRSGIIGLVIPQAMQSIFDDPYFPRLIQGISQACNTHNYILSLFLFQTAEEEARLYPKILRNQLFDGLIIASSEKDDMFVSQLLAHNIPFVLNGRHDNPKVSFVDADNLAGAYNAVSYLIRLGYRRIATITGPLNTWAGIDRKQGYINALRDRGIAVDPDLSVPGDYTEVSGYEATNRLIPHKPEAIFIASDTMALGALRALREHGLSAPNDIALVGFDDMPMIATANPPLTTIRQPIQQAGKQTVEVLIDILENGLEPPRHVIMPTNLVVRQSCGALAIDLN